MNIRHPGQLKILKSWGPFWSYQLNRTANLAHLPRNRQNGLNWQWTIYSATTILEKCRKVVLEKWFCKLGFFFLVNHFSPTWKKLDLWYKTTFFSGQPLFSNQISRTRFLEPDFSNQISWTRFLKNCKNWGRRIKGWICAIKSYLIKFNECIST